MSRAAPRKRLPRFPAPLRWFHGRVETDGQCIRAISGSAGPGGEVGANDVRRLHAWLTRWLAATFGLGVIFVLLQTANWYGLALREVTARTNLYAFTFFMLTGLHAAHVVGGLIPLGVVLAKSVRGRYGSGYHPGVRYMAMYWHFLDVVWIVLFAVLVIFG